MKIFGLIGYPLGHSFSKDYFTKKFLDENIKNCSYQNFEIEYKPHSPERLNYIMSEVKNWDKTIRKSSSKQRSYRFLEIGSARGAFVKSFNDIGWDSHGIEPSEGLYNYSKNQYNLTRASFFNNH